MGQAVRKVKPPPPSRTVAPPAPPAPPSEEAASDAAAAPTAVKRRPAAGDVRPAPPEPQRIIDPAEPDDGNEWNRPNPNFVSMSQKVVGSITTRHGGSKELPKSAIKNDSFRPMPVDRHTTLESGPDEVTVRAPGTLNHAHLRELFLLHQGKGEGQEAGPMDVESLAKRFNVDVEILRRVLHHTALVHSEMPTAAAVAARRPVTASSSSQGR